MTPVRLLVADKQPLMRQALALLLGPADGVTVVGQAAHAPRTSELCKALRPDVLLLDVSLLVQGGASIKRILTRSSSPRVVLFAADDQVNAAAVGMKAGAVGCLFRNAELRGVLHTLRRVHAGEMIIPAKVMQVVAQQNRGTTSTTEALTKRELDVLCLLAEGQTNKQIGYQLGLAEGTVKVHVGNILGKLGVSTRTKAVVWAIDTGFLCSCQYAS
jgi:two-component system nitrate/nitrite response regulator NarL